MPIWYLRHQIIQKQGCQTGFSLLSPWYYCRLFSSSPKKPSKLKKLKHKTQGFGKSSKNQCRKKAKVQKWEPIRLKWQIHGYKYKSLVKNTKFEEKFTKSSEKFSKLNIFRRNSKTLAKNSRFWLVYNAENR